MSPADIAAYIGAAAWAPQIASWLYKKWAKPQLGVMPATTMAITYSDAGPTVKVMLSVETQRCDVVVDRVELRIRHEQGEERRLWWSQIGELTQQQTSPPTAIKITTTSLLDRQIVFQDTRFTAGLRKLNDAIIEHFNYLRATNSEALQLTLQSKEVHQARQSFEQGFYWKPGEYVFEIRLHSKSMRNPYTERFEITLSTADCDSLKANCDLFESYISAAILAASGIPTNLPTWKWVTPDIHRMRYR